ncbi:hypothetical protein D3C83_173390 [compost metagenome]
MSGFKYPRSFGFTGSADRAEGRVAVRPHTRQKFAKGGKVFSKPSSNAKVRRAGDTIRGGTRADQMRKLGLKHGGKVKQ